MESLTKLTVPSQVMSRQVGDETVILDLSRGMYFSLDPVGARIWQLLTEGQHQEFIVSTLLVEYDVTEQQLRQDVSNLVQELIARGLLQIE
jgi:hypothetical protein